MGRDELVLQWKQEQDNFFCLFSTGATAIGSMCGTHPSWSRFLNFVRGIRMGKAGRYVRMETYYHRHLTFVGNEPTLQEAHF